MYSVKTHEIKNETGELRFIGVKNNTQKIFKSKTYRGQTEGKQSWPKK